MIRILKGLTVLCAFTATAACSQYTAYRSPIRPLGQKPIDTHDTHQKLSQIFITDSFGSPISGALVMIGTAQDRPFPNNTFTTDSAGSFQPPQAWNSELPITITAPGFVRTTYMNQLATQKTFAVHAKSPAIKPELNGITTGFGDLKKDGFVDVGVVIPALTRLDLASFQASTLLSPEIDTIKTVGQTLHVPSNITLPDQSENVFPVVVRLNKPTYRMFVDRHASYKVVSAHVKFPLKKVISETQDGKDGIELMNYFTFLEAGVNNTIIASDKQSVNLPVNQLQFSSTVSAVAPTIDKAQGIIAVALVKDGDHLYPTDIKNLVSKEMRALSYPASSTGFILGALHNEVLSPLGAANDFMSVELKETSHAGEFQFLPMVAAPKVALGTLTLNPPALPTKLNSVATFASLSKIEVKKMGEKSYEVKNPEWDVYVPAWVSEIALPSMTLELAPNQMRWEATFMAAPKGASPSELGPGLMNSVTHLTRSAVDL